MTLAGHHAGDNADSGRCFELRIAAVIPALNEAISIARVVEDLREQVRCTSILACRTDRKHSKRVP
jgi:hypothetical protein